MARQPGHSFLVAYGSARLAVSERLAALWRQTQTTEPDADAISEALDETQPAADHDEERWFAAARDYLNL
jgi:hypothetical protein